jgi:hypothetical protein
MVLFVCLWCFTPLSTIFQSVLWVEETGISGVNHRPHWQTCDCAIDFASFFLRFFYWNLKLFRHYAIFVFHLIKFGIVPTSWVVFFYFNNTFDGLTNIIIAKSIAQSHKLRNNSTVFEVGGVIWGFNGRKCRFTGDAKTDICDRQIHNLHRQLFKYSTVIMIHWEHLKSCRCQLWIWRTIF